MLEGDQRLRPRSGCSAVQGDTSALQAVEPPVEVPGFEMVMLWHERSHRDPAHQWLGEYIADSA